VDDPYLDGAGIRRNQRRILGVALLVQFDTDKTEAIADPLSDRRGVFAHASCEDEGVEAAERRREAPAQATCAGAPRAASPPDVLYSLLLPDLTRRELELQLAAIC
jgi:hypothetical protein